MGKTIREIDHGVRRVAGVDVRVTELIWDDGGRSFAVHRVDTDDDLTADECFDQMPTDEQISTLLQQQPGVWTCPGCGAQFDDTQADLIVDHVQIFCDRVDGAGNPVRDQP
jgi:hypothetical protein